MAIHCQKQFGQGLLFTYNVFLAVTADDNRGKMFSPNAYVFKDDHLEFIIIKEEKDTEDHQELGLVKEEEEEEEAVLAAEGSKCKMTVKKEPFPRNESESFEEVKVRYIV